MNVTPNVQFPINLLSLSGYRDFTYKQFARQYARYPTKGQPDLFNNCHECFRSLTSPVLAGTRRIKKKRKEKERKYDDSFRKIMKFLSRSLRNDLVRRLFVNRYLNNKIIK